MLRLLAVVSAACAVGSLVGPAAALGEAPTVTNLTPDSGGAAGGTVVTVEGSGFDAGAVVSFAGTSATQVDVTSATSLTAVSPPGSGTIDVTVKDANGSSLAVSHDWFAYEPPRGGFWLGLNGNSDSSTYTSEWLGPVDEFSRRGIVYDRSFELTAGQIPAETEGDSKGGTFIEDKLELDHEHGMIPVSTIEYPGYSGDLTSDPSFPQEQRTSGEEAEGKTTISQYVDGFVRSATALLSQVSQKYPGMPVLLEPMNEPWGYTTPLDNGAEYARVIAKLLPAARAAGIPLSDIYVSAFGADKRLNEAGEAEFFAPGWVTAMYAAEPSLKTEIQGWYFHPYGPASGTEFYDSWGIQSLPEVRRQMSSGENNIIVSEVGYCARSEGGDCHESGESEVETREEASARLTSMLEHARPYYEAGWLKALIVYGRGGGGWSMVEYPSAQLSKQGEALEAFALAHGTAEPRREELCPHAGSPCSVEAGPDGQSGTSPERPTSPTGSTGGESISLAIKPLPGSLALPARGRLALSSSLITVRGGAARIMLSCGGNVPCGGRLTLLVRGARGREGRRRARSVMIGSGAFFVAPGPPAPITLKVSRRGRALLGAIRGRRNRLVGVLTIGQTLPANLPVEHEDVKLTPSR